MLLQCLMLERQKKYRYLRQIELWNCSLSPKSAVRFSECLPTTQLTWLTLDDNELVKSPFVTFDAKLYPGTQIEVQVEMIN